MVPMLFLSPLCVDTLHILSCLTSKSLSRFCTHRTDEETKTQNVLAITQSRGFLASFSQYDLNVWH